MGGERVRKGEMRRRNGDRDRIYGGREREKEREKEREIERKREREQ